MKCEFTMQQMRKLSRISAQAWKALFVFIEKDKGLGEYAPDLEELVEVGLVCHSNKLAYARFLVDGRKPLMQKIGAAARAVSNPQSVLYAFYYIWDQNYRRYFGEKPILTGRDQSAAKSLINTYSLADLTEMACVYMKAFRGNTVWGLWRDRHKVRQEKSADDPYAFLEDRDE